MKGTLHLEGKRGSSLGYKKKKKRGAIGEKGRVSVEKGGGTVEISGKKGVGGGKKETPN